MSQASCSKLFEPGHVVALLSERLRQNRKGGVVGIVANVVNKYVKKALKIKFPASGI
jgi:hypothetical protein